MPMLVFSLPVSARTIQHRSDVHAYYHRVLCLLIAYLKIILSTMAIILTSYLEREGQGGHHCMSCQNFEEALKQNSSRAINKKRGDTGKLYKFTNTVYMAS
jgi:hypothetical protein